jgi:hypothetical protein
MKRTFAAATSSYNDVSFVAGALSSFSSIPASTRQYVTYVTKEDKYGVVKNIYMNLVMWIKQTNIVLLELLELQVVENPALI